MTALHGRACPRADPLFCTSGLSCSHLVPAGKAAANALFRYQTRCSPQNVHDVQGKTVGIRKLGSLANFLRIPSRPSTHASSLASASSASRSDGMRTGRMEQKPLLVLIHQSNNGACKVPACAPCFSRGSRSPQGLAQLRRRLGEAGNGCIRQSGHLGCRGL